MRLCQGQDSPSSKELHAQGPKTPAPWPWESRLWGGHRWGAGQSLPGSRHWSPPLEAEGSRFPPSLVHSGLKDKDTPAPGCPAPASCRHHWG